MGTASGVRGLFIVLIGAMLALGAAMAFAIIFTTMTVNIAERQRELATLRAAGVRHGAVAGVVGGENTLVARWALCPGWCWASMRPGR